MSHSLYSGSDLYFPSAVDGRDRPQQQPGIGIVRIDEDLIRSPPVHEFAFVPYGDLVAHLVSRRQVMQAVHEAQVVRVPQLLEEVHYVRPAAGSSDLGRPAKGSVPGNATFSL